jgi:hypothetical protein
MSEITDEMLMAFADGQLAAADRRRVADYIATRPEARARVEMFKKTSAELGTLFNVALVEPVPAKLLAAINSASSTGRRAPQKASAPHTTSLMSSIFEVIFPSWPTLITSGAFAATLVIGTVIGSQWQSAPQSSAIQWQDMVALNEGRILAKDNFRDGLEKTALGTRIALSDGLTFTPVMTFERKGGGYCRQYSLENNAGSQVAGVGCRNSAGDWTVEVQSEITGSANARNQNANKVEVAGATTSPVVDKAVDKLIKGDVIAKEAEAQLLAGNWQTKSLR